MNIQKDIRVDAVSDDRDAAGFVILSRRFDAEMTHQDVR